MKSLRLTLLTTLLFVACAAPKSTKGVAVGGSASGDQVARHSGIRLTYALPPLPERSQEAGEELLEKALPILGLRLEELGLHSPSVLRIENEIIIELAREDEERLEQVRRVIPQAARLDFRLVRTGSDFMKNLCASVATDSRAGVMKIETGLDIWQARGRTVKECYLSAVDRTAMLTAEEASAEGCKSRGDVERTACVVSGRRILERYLEGLKLDVGTDLLFELSESSELKNEVGERFWRSYYLDDKISLSGQVVVSAEVKEDQIGGIGIQLALSKKGAREFEKLTRKHVGHKLAIVLDGRIESAPVIREAIAGGQVILHLGPDMENESSRAEELATALRSGALPDSLVEVSLSYF